MLNSDLKKTFLATEFDFFLRKTIYYLAKVHLLKMIRNLKNKSEAIILKLKNHAWFVAIAENINASFVEHLTVKSVVRPPTQKVAV